MGITRNEFLKVSTAMMAAGGSHFAATAADGAKPVPPIAACAGMDQLAEALEDGAMS